MARPKNDKDTTVLFIQSYNIRNSLLYVDDKIYKCKVCIELGSHNESKDTEETKDIRVSLLVEKNILPEFLEKSSTHFLNTELKLTFVIDKEITYYFNGSDIIICTLGLLDIEPIDQNSCIVYTTTRLNRTDIPLWYKCFVSNEINAFNKKDKDYMRFSALLNDIDY